MHAMLASTTHRHLPVLHPVEPRRTVLMALSPPRTSSLPFSLPNQSATFTDFKLVKTVSLISFLFFRFR